MAGLFVCYTQLHSIVTTEAQPSTYTMMACSQADKIDQVSVLTGVVMDLSPDGGAARSWSLWFFGAACPPFSRGQITLHRHMHRSLCACLILLFVARNAHYARDPQLIEFLTLAISDRSAVIRNLLSFCRHPARHSHAGLMRRSARASLNVTNSFKMNVIDQKNASRITEYISGAPGELPESAQFFPP